MRVRVLQGESVCYKGVWYNQAEQFDVEDLGNLEGKVEVIDPRKPVKSTKKEEG